jgi:hypothetical protein
MASDQLCSIGGVAISTNDTYVTDMSMKSPSERSQALRERQRLAAEEGMIALAEYEAHDIAVRKNMAKLRALRLAKEAAASAEVSVKSSRKTRRK